MSILQLYLNHLNTKRTNQTSVCGQTISTDEMGNARASILQLDISFKWLWSRAARFAQHIASVSEAIAINHRRPIISPHLKVTQFTRVLRTIFGPNSRTNNESAQRLRREMIRAHWLEWKVDFFVFRVKVDFVFTELAVCSSALHTSRQHVCHEI